MKIRHNHTNNGSALILVVVVTVLLAVVGVMFLMVSRAGETEAGAVIQNKDLDAAVQTVVSRINEVLVEDLFGRKRVNLTSPYQLDSLMADAQESLIDQFNLLSDEPYDFPSHKGAGVLNDSIHPGLDPAIKTDDLWLPGQLDDYWLASLEPVWQGAGKDTIVNTADDIYVWPHITDLWGTLQGSTDSLYYQQYIAADHVLFSNGTFGKRWIDPDSTSNLIVNDTVDGWTTSALWNKWQVSAYNVRAKIIKPKDRMEVAAAGFVGADTGGGSNYPLTWETAAFVAPFGARADADGDGVADSRWVQIPSLSTSRGEAVFAAVRIIDNCAMLNLNAAGCFDVRPYADSKKGSPFREDWKYWDSAYTQQVWHSNSGSGTGRYLSEINYLPFLRGRDLNGNFFDGSSSGDDWYNLMIAKGLFRQSGATRYPSLPQTSHLAFMNIEKPQTAFSFFDIGDELELRNRYLVTSLTQARFEQTNVAHFTLDAGGGTYGALETPVDDSGAFGAWKIKVNPTNFEKWNALGALLPNTEPWFRYDRRHACTFYSFDRILRQGPYPVLDAALAVLAANNLPNASAAQKAKEIFKPVGAVTTNLAVPVFSTATKTYQYSYNNVETRRRILHLLYALREYYLPDDYAALPAADQTAEKRKAALKAAQIVANLIDFSDNNSANTGSATDTQGPFYSPVFSVSSKTINYGQQANVDCTFLTKQIIDDMIYEVSYARLGQAINVNANSSYLNLDFGLAANDVVFGYERQPFISEVYAKWNGSLGPNAALEAFAIEVLNPYSTPIDVENWAIKIGNSTTVPFNNNSAWDVPGFAAGVPGRAVYHGSGSVSVPGGVLITPAVSQLDSLDTFYNDAAETVEIQLLRPAPQWVKTNLGIQYITADKVSNTDVRSILYSDGQNALKRDDRQWKFINADYQKQRAVDSNFTYTVGQANGVTLSVKGFQLSVPDNGLPLERWHELEMLAVQGNGPVADPNAALTFKLTMPDTQGYFDLVENPDTADVLDYLCTINRPDFGSLPGRININTAPIHVIAAAIPPVLADPNAADPAKIVTFSSLQLAQEIVNHRPYKKLGDLLTNVPQMKQYSSGSHKADNVGNQTIDDDIEERDWILSHLANKFTVRSDTFTAYILVRSGTDGPQRRMIAIFDRSQVWTNNDRPRLVALHPVPDPR
jgi:hypothetical protein